MLDPIKFTIKWRHSFWNSSIFWKALGLSALLHSLFFMIFQAKKPYFEQHCVDFNCHHLEMEIKAYHPTFIENSLNDRVGFEECNEPQLPFTMISPLPRAIIHHDFLDYNFEEEIEYDD